MQQAEALAWLTTPAGAELLSEAEGLPPDRLTRLTRLRKRYPVEIATAAVELLELRRRARPKFVRAETMFFTPEGLEQATGDTIAQYRAARFPCETPLLDACCGIGGDARFLADRGPTLAVDRNLAAAVCAHANASRSEPPTRFPLYTLCADVTALDLHRLQARGVRAALFDPSRRASDRYGERRRARASEDYTPPLSWLEALYAHFPSVAVKVSPAIDDAALQRYPGRVEFLSERGECKEAVLWFGPPAETLPALPEAGRYTATVLRPGHPPATLVGTAGAPPSVSAPRAWLYEPDPAVIRAHLLPEVASSLDAALLDPGVAYLTADAFFPTPFATAYRVRDWMPYHLRNLQVWLRAHHRSVSAIKKRGVPFEPEELRKKLMPPETAGAPPVVVVLAPHAGRPIALLCDPPTAE